MQGIVIHFDSQRGFGFIRTNEFSEDVFVHVSQIRDRQILLQGQSVCFEVEKNEKGYSAIQVIPGRKRLSPYQLYGGIAGAMILFGTAYLAGKGISLWLAFLIAINIVTFMGYGYDKLIARTRFLRIPEWILHGLAFCGGSPLALIGQKIFHHKTRKRSFQIAFWTIAILQIAGILLQFIL